jgi:uncharacterized membrane protein
MTVEAVLRELAGLTALVVEALAVILIAFGAAQAFYNTFDHFIRGGSDKSWRAKIFVRFGMWLLFGLQFALAADIVRSVISPTWNDIGQLAAIAVIRTFLNYFLERDLQEVQERPISKSAADAVRAPTA